MDNLDSVDILIESLKYTSEIIINITDKINNLENKNANMEQILNDQIKINEKNIKKIDYLDKIIKELTSDSKNNYLNNKTKRIIKDENETDSIIDFQIINEEEKEEKEEKEKEETKYIKEENNLLEIQTGIEKNTGANILIEKLINHKKNLENQKNTEYNEINSKKVDLSGEKILRTTAESLIIKRRTNVFRKL
jgi:hypothetical protein